MAKNMPSHRAKYARHSHDISAGYTSSLAPALIVPQYFDILQPGDSIYFKQIAFTRLRDMVTAFLGEVDLHFDAFFVPLQMMYTSFGNVFFGINEPLTDMQITQTPILTSKFPILNVTETIHQRANSFQVRSDLECWGKSCTRLMDALDMNKYGCLSQYQADLDEAAADGSVVDCANNPNVSPWILAAYQAIYQKYFRNDDIERFQVNAYNFDSHFNGSQPFSQPLMLELRYCQRIPDYFTTFKISPIASAVNGVGNISSIYTGNITNDGGNFLNQQYLARVNNWLGENSNNISVADASLDSPNVGAAATQLMEGESSNTTANLRALFAVEKYMRIWGRADKTYDDQVLAHFGYKVPHDVKHQITHIKHNHMVIQSDPVYASGSEEYALGQVGGQASGTLTTDGEKFTAPVHGVFMVVAYAVTKPRYQDTFNKLHMLSDRIDFPVPEYDALGMQPLYGFEANPIFMHSDNEPLGDQGYNYKARLGWQYRYSQFKRKYNRISLGYSLFQGFGGAQGSVNPYQPWVLSRQPFTFYRPTGVLPDYNDYGLDAFSLFEKPTTLNSVMVTPYNGAWSNDYYANPHSMFDTDPIILEYFCDCKKVSWMSETGEPSL